MAKNLLAGSARFPAELAWLLCSVFGSAMAPVEHTVFRFCRKASVEDRAVVEKSRRYQTEVRRGLLESRLRQTTGSGFRTAVVTRSGWKRGGGLERCNVFVSDT